jgi:hypothetical protein
MNTIGKGFGDGEHWFNGVDFDEDYSTANKKAVGAKRTITASYMLEVPSLVTQEESCHAHSGRKRVFFVSPEGIRD